MYLALILGGLTMVVPFMVMISSSFKSSVDGQKYDLFPAYFHDQRMLTLKYLEQKTDYELPVFLLVARSNVPKLEDYTLPAPANQAMVTDYYAFVKTLPTNYTFMADRGPQVGYPQNFGTHNLVYAYRKAILAKYGNLRAIEKAYAQDLVDQEALMPPFERWFERGFTPEYTARLDEYLHFKDGLAPEHKIPIPAESIWNQHLRVKYSKIEDGNKELGTAYASIEAADMPTSLPKTNSEAHKKAWEDVVRNDMPIWFIRADESARPAWNAFLRERYLNDPALYNKSHPDAKITGFTHIPLPAETPYQNSVAMGEWGDFVTNDIPVTAIRLDTPEQRYRTFLRTTKRYATIGDVNRAYGTDYRNFAEIYLPTTRVLTAEATKKAGAIRWEFALRNYKTVASYLVLHGRSFLNSLIYIAMALFFTLTVNPITAYALSRFKLKATNKVLLFLLATMAFPAEIAMIPNFLILKELHLLNTFWALVLPGMASGFSIFLLKGMFDGLPQDLYEAASLDGANELTIFWRVTMPLVKPFLAYLSLGTFIAAYSAFAFAIILCPDPKMWTMMVFLQQMVWASEPVKFAAYVLASIPTLIVFVTCQRVIMQGIVLPTEK